MGRIMFFGSGMPMDGMHMGHNFMHGMGGWNMPIFMMPQPMMCHAPMYACGRYTFEGLKKVGKFVNDKLLKPLNKHVLKPVWENVGKPVCNFLKFCWDNSLGRVFKWMGGLGKKKQA